VYSFECIIYNQSDLVKQAPSLSPVARISYLIAIEFVKIITCIRAATRATIPLQSVLNNREPRCMNSLTIKRIVVWAVSLVLGFLSAYGVITIGFSLLPSLSLPPIITPVASEAISIERYGIIYFLTTMLPLSLLFLVWLDYFLGTKILPD
jgi:hypothetical protein